MRNYRPDIAINEMSGERKGDASVYAFCKEQKCNHVTVLVALAMGTAANGWKVFDVPDNIRKRIAELEEQIKMLE